MYWYSLLKIPDKSEFPGTGDKGNGISENIKTQEQWVDTVKNACQSSDLLGSKGIRTVPKLFQESGNSFQAWARRTQAGQAMTNMATGLGYMGAEAALKRFADWTDRVAGGELPFEKPGRPQGIERNVVITMWDWSTNKAYLHDSIATDKDNPTVNANGKIYGAPEESTDMVPVLDPVKHIATQIQHPWRDPQTPSSASLPRGPSAYWGNEPAWDGHTSIHNPMMDREGRVWFTSRIRPAAAQPAYCSDGSLPSSKVAPLKESPRHLSMYDPKTNTWTLISTCFATHHLYFASKDPNYTLWTSAGGPGGGVVGWLNTKKYFETGGVDAARERAHRKLRPAQVQGPAQRPRGSERQALPGRLDALPHDRAAVQRTRRLRQRQPCLLYLGRSLQQLRPWRQRADRADQRQRVADGGGRRQDHRLPRPVPARLLHQERRRAHRRCAGRLEGPRDVDHLRHAHQLPQRRRHRQQAQGLQAAAAPRSARSVARDQSTID